MDKCRQEFEEWYRREYWDFKYEGRDLSPFTPETNKYSNCSVQLGWMAWQESGNRRTVKQEQEPFAWFAPNFVFSFATKEAADRYLENVNDTRKSFPLFTHPPADAQQHTGLIYTCSCDAYKLEIERLKAELEMYLTGCADMSKMIVKLNSQLSAIRGAVEKLKGIAQQGNATAAECVECIYEIEAILDAVEIKP